MPDPGSGLWASGRRLARSDGRHVLVQPDAVGGMVDGTAAANAHAKHDPRAHVICEGTITRKKIAIIEDSGFVVSVYRAKLQSEGYDIQVAADGEAGLALVNSIEPDLVVLDLGLPKLSGVAVLQEIRIQGRFKALPVYVLSGAYGAQAVDAAWAAGATGVLSKSADTPNAVVEVIRAALAAA